MFRKSLFTILLSSIVLGGCGKGEVIETEEVVVGTEKPIEGQTIETISGQSNQVSVSDAQMALKNYIIQNNLSQKFINGKVVLEDQFYDVDDTLLAYYFTVEGTETENYFIVSAVDTLDPIHGI
jgi:purine-nucleoside phosphorylase